MAGSGKMPCKTEVIGRKKTVKKIRVITAVILIIALSFVTVIGSAENDIENKGIIQAEEQFVEKLLYLGVITEAYADLDSVVTRAVWQRLLWFR